MCIEIVRDVIQAITDSEKFVRENIKSLMHVDQLAVQEIAKQRNKSSLAQLTKFVVCHMA